MPILHEVKEGTKTKIYCQAIVLDMHCFTVTDHQSGSS